MMGLNLSLSLGRPQTSGVTPVPPQDFWQSATLTAGDASTGDDEWQMVEMTVETIDG